MQAEVLPAKMRCEAGDLPLACMGSSTTSPPRMYIRNAGVTDDTCWLAALTLPLDTSSESVTSVLLPDSIGYSVSAWLG